MLDQPRHVLFVIFPLGWNIHFGLSILPLSAFCRVPFQLPFFLLTHRYIHSFPAGKTSAPKSVSYGNCLLQNCSGTESPQMSQSSSTSATNSLCFGYRTLIIIMYVQLTRTNNVMTIAAVLQKMYGDHNEGHWYYPHFSTISSPCNSLERPELFRPSERCVVSAAAPFPKISIERTCTSGKDT